MEKTASLKEANQYPDMSNLLDALLDLCPKKKPLPPLLQSQDIHLFLSNTALILQKHSAFCPEMKKSYLL